MERKRFILLAHDQRHYCYRYGWRWFEVDPEQPDYDRHPLYRNAKTIECIVEPGDMLYLPPGMLHHVRSLECAISFNVDWHTKGTALERAIGVLPGHAAKKHVLQRRHHFGDVYGSLGKAGLAVFSVLFELRVVRIHEKSLRGGIAVKSQQQPKPIAQQDNTVAVKHLVELLRIRAQEQPHDTAYLFLADGEREGVRVSFEELDQRARAIAAHLQTMSMSGQRALLLYPPIALHQSLLRLPLREGSRRSRLSPIASSPQSPPGNSRGCRAGHRDDDGRVAGKALGPLS